VYDLELAKIVQKKNSVQYYFSINLGIDR